MQLLMDHTIMHYLARDAGDHIEHVTLTSKSVWKVSCFCNFTCPPNFQTRTQPCKHYCGGRNYKYGIIPKLNWVVKNGGYFFMQMQSDFEILRPCGPSALPSRSRPVLCKSSLKGALPGLFCLACILDILKDLKCLQDLRSLRLEILVYLVSFFF